MKKLFLLLFLSMSFFVFSLDFGFLLNDTFSTENEKTISNVTWTNYTTLYGWIGHEFNKNISLIVSGTVRLDVKPSGLSYKLYLNNTALNLKFTGLPSNSSIDSSIGRVKVTDSAGELFTGLMDGASVSYYINGMALRFLTAYTGLILESELDLTKTDSNLQNPNMFFSTKFAPRRIIGSLALSNISLFKTRFTVATELIGNFDIDSGVKTHAQYASISVKGSIIPSKLYISGFFIGSLAENSAGKVNAGFAAGVSADAMFSVAAANFHNRLFFKAKFASGASISAFYPVLSSSTAIAVKLPFTGITKIQLGNSLKKGFFVFNVSASAFLRDPKQQIAEYGALDNAQIYTGSEVAAGFYIAPLVDLQFNVSGACFFPGTAFAAGTDPRWTVTAGATLTF